MLGGPLYSITRHISGGLFKTIDSQLVEHMSGLLVQDCGLFSAVAMEIQKSCMKPMIFG